MAVVNTALDFVYLAHPHTASRGTVEALLKLDGSVEASHHHAILSKVIDECPEAADCSVVFQTVRHPCDWLVSRYLCNGGQRGDWHTWLQRRSKRPIFNRFLGQITTFAKYENLGPDLARITGREVDLEWDAEHKTPDKPRDYMSYWDHEELAWCKHHFAYDFEAYDYE